MWHQIWSFFNSNSGAVEGLAALASMILTCVLVLITLMYVSITNKTFHVSLQQVRVGLQPQVLPEVNYETKPSMKGTVILRNIGTLYFKIIEVNLSFYCNKSESQMQSMELARSPYRLVPAGRDVILDFHLNLETYEYFYHEPHEGSCNWLAELNLTLEDLVGFGRHTYRWDEQLGLSYLPIAPMTWRGWLRMQRRKWYNRTAFWRYKLKFLIHRKRPAPF